MGLIPAITTEFILSHLEESQIFSAYFEPVSLKKVYSSPFRRDRNPSCSFYYGNTGRLMFYDFARDESLDCFAFVAKKEMLNDLPSACRRIAEDFGLIKGFKPSFNLNKIKKTEQVLEKVKKETVIEYQRSEWTDEELAYWKQYEITEEELRREYIHPVHKLKINEKAIPNWRKELRFGFDIHVRDRVYTKLYTPYAEKDHFKWISNIPLHIPFGLLELPYLSNVLIISKSQKERILFKKYFTDVIALQNEGKGSLSEKTAAHIKQRYDTVFLAFDSDPAGYKAADYYSETFGFSPIYVPEKATQQKGVKDWAELVEIYGLHVMEKYLNHINLL